MDQPKAGQPLIALRDMGFLRYLLFGASLSPWRSSYVIDYIYFTVSTPSVK
jgi:hypothetical protein